MWTCASHDVNRYWSFAKSRQCYYFKAHLESWYNDIKSEIEDMSSENKVKLISRYLYPSQVCTL